MIYRNIQEFYIKLRINQPILGIDFGTKKIGLAISSSNHSFSLPFKVIPNDTNLFNNIENYIKQKNIGSFVIGEPFNMDGTQTSSSKKLHGFVNRLSEKFELPIYLIDERLTSIAADNLLKSAGIKRIDRNQFDDSFAANIILENALNQISRIKLL